MVVLLLLLLLRAERLRALSGCAWDNYWRARGESVVSHSQTRRLLLPLLRFACAGRFSASTPTDALVVIAIYPVTRTQELPQELR